MMLSTRVILCCYLLCVLDVYASQPTSTDRKKRNSFPGVQGHAQSSNAFFLKRRQDSKSAEEQLSETECETTCGEPSYDRIQRYESCLSSLLSRDICPDDVVRGKLEALEACRTEVATCDTVQPAGIFIRAQITDCKLHKLSGFLYSNDKLCAASMETTFAIETECVKQMEKCLAMSEDNTERVEKCLQKFLLETRCKLVTGYIEEMLDYIECEKEIKSCEGQAGEESLIASGMEVEIARKEAVFRCKLRLLADLNSDNTMASALCRAKMDTNIQDEEACLSKLNCGKEESLIVNVFKTCLEGFLEENMTCSLVRDLVQQLISYIDAEDSASP